MTKRSLLKAIVLLCAVAMPGFIQAKVYYMAKTGKNTNAGTLDAPFATIDRFWEKCVPGDTLLIRGGIYLEHSTYIWKSGSAGLPVTIKNYPGEVPVFDGNSIAKPSTAPTIFMYSDDGSWNKNKVSYFEYVTIEGLIIRNYRQSAFNLGCNYTQTDRTQRISHLTIRNCVVDNIGQNGISVSMANHVLVENCMVSRTGYGMYSWSSGINYYNMTGRENIVRNCVSFHHIDVSPNHTDGNGFILDIYPPELFDIGSGVILENNLFFENGGAGVAITRTDNVYMTNNTLYENGKDPRFMDPGRGIGLWRDNSIGAFKNINIKKNVVYQSNGNGMKLDSPISGGVISHNTVSKPSSINYPVFTDVAVNDFTLQNSSVAVDAGTTDGAPTVALVFDHKAIKSQTTGQPVAWYHLSPDFDYIISKGGIENCIKTVQRPMGGAPDQGCFEHTEAKITVAASGINLVPAEITLPDGTSRMLSATFIPSNSSNQTVTWSSDKPSVASVNAITGLVAAISVGSATITVTSKDGNFKSQTKVTVTANASNKELCSNGGFEQDWKDWGYKDAGVTIISANQNAGNKAVRVKNGFFDRWFFNLKTNTDYELSAWIKVASGYMQIGIADSKNTTYYFESKSATYERVSKIFNTGTSTDWKIYGYNGNMANTDAFVDDISLKEVVPTAVPEIKESEIAVYPNPVQNHFVVKAPLGSTIQVIDLTGKIMIQRLSVSETETFDVSGLNNALFLVKIVNGNKTSTQKIVKN
jgi:parallel beta-helix repeat protein